MSGNHKTPCRNIASEASSNEDVIAELVEAGERY